MDDSALRKGHNGEPHPDDLLTVGEVAAMYGITRAAVQQWKLRPAKLVPWGRGKLRLYRRADVEAYASSARRLNRLPKPTKPKN